MTGAPPLGILLGICCLLASQCNLVDALNRRFDLNGEWQVRSANGSIKTTGIVPGQIHTDLLRNKLIEDPYYRFNDVEYQWIANTDWIYSKTFDIPRDWQRTQGVRLVLEGLDTVASVTLNGKHVASTDNMFRRYVVPVNVSEGSNQLTVSFSNAPGEALHRNQAYTPMPKDGLPPNCPPSVQNGFCHINMLRKEQCSFSWDWGPAYAPQGIWRNIYLEAYDTATLRDVMASMTLTDSKLNEWKVDVVAYFESFSGVQGTVNASIPALEGAAVSEHVTFKMNGENVVRMSFVAKNPSLWMPAGYGTAHLYSLNVSFTDSGDVTFAASRVVRVGFRTVELVQDAIQPQGATFYFRVNNIPIFTKGSNWIPVDSFSARATPDVLRRTLISAKEANMNLVRVWGGGIYQDDDFYDIADELGIMVWQEFMFACAMYGVHPTFLNSIAEEVKYQMRRLQSHSSIIVWSGNNENEAAVSGNWYGTNNDLAVYIDLYGELYFGTVKTNVTALDTSRPFISSSPSNGDETPSHPVDDNPYWQWRGDTHYYNYLADCWDTSTYPIPRYASEYGFQSFPSFDTLSKVSVEGDWTFNSDFMLHRQHHENGNSEMMQQAGYHYAVPEKGNSLENYKDTIYIAQLMQASCIKIETEHYRRWRSYLDSTGRGNTMGTIYWQLNDIWQGASWASIEYGEDGRLCIITPRRCMLPSCSRPTPTREEISTSTESQISSHL